MNRNESTNKRKNKTAAKGRSCERLALWEDCICNGDGSYLLSPGADVGRVEAQMWAESRRRCGPSRGADVGRVAAQMWAESRRRCGRVAAQMWPSPRTDVVRVPLAVVVSLRVHCRLQSYVP
jgi:hypothetical protein